MFVKYFTSSRDLAQLITCMNNYTLQLSPGDSSLICILFVLICPSELVHRKGGGGGDSYMEQTGMLVGKFEFNP